MQNMESWTCHYSAYLCHICCHITHNTLHILLHILLISLPILHFLFIYSIFCEIFCMIYCIFCIFFTYSAYFLAYSAFFLHILHVVRHILLVSSSIFCIFLVISFGILWNESDQIALLHQLIGFASGPGLHQGSSLTVCSIAKHYSGTLAICLGGVCKLAWQQFPRNCCHKSK